MRRRDFVTLVGSAAVAWPLPVFAQQSKRRIGVLMSTAAQDREGQARHAAFVDGLRELGQIEGRDLQIETRWPVGDAARSQFAEELVRLAPDVIVASGSANVTALQRITRSLPIVFANVIDPVGAGLVASLSRPGGNTTGFSSFDYSLSGKWLELLKQIAPNLTRIAVLRDPALPRRNRPVRRDPGDDATVIWGGADHDCQSRAWRDRACHHCLRARAEWRPDRDSKSIGRNPSRSDHFGSDALPSSECLSVPILPGKWRSRVLRA